MCVIHIQQSEGRNSPDEVCDDEELHDAVDDADGPALHYHWLGGFIGEEVRYAGPHLGGNSTITSVRSGWTVGTDKWRGSEFQMLVSTGDWHLRGPFGEIFQVPHREQQLFFFMENKVKKRLQLTGLLQLLNK